MVVKTIIVVVGGARSCRERSGQWAQTGENDAGSRCVSSSLVSMRCLSGEWKAQGRRVVDAAVRSRHPSIVRRIQWPPPQNFAAGKKNFNVPRASYT